MNELAKHLTKVLLTGAIVFAAGSIWRFESVATEVRNVQEEMNSYYAKKSDVKLVQKELEHLKEGQDEMKADLKELLKEFKK